MNKTELITLLQNLPDDAPITLWHFDYNHDPISWETILQPACNQPADHLILFSLPWYPLPSAMLPQAISSHKTEAQRNHQISRIAGQLSQTGRFIALCAILHGRSILQALLIAQSYKHADDD